MPERPTGTVTFLFTDLEGSTRLWEEHPEAMRDALQRHDHLLVTVVDAHGGYLVKTTGDGVVAVFPTADAAIAAALAAQSALQSEPWGSTGALKVRMGLHTGSAEPRDGDYFGPTVNRAARLMAAAHGGQIVCSQATAGLTTEELGASVELFDLGEHHLRDLTRPERVLQVAGRGLPHDFPPLRSLDVRPTNLPAQTTSFIGRERLVRDVTTALGDSRIVTVTGVGGVGKTRLALQVARELVPRYRDGAWLIELAPVADPDALVEAVAASLDVSPRPGRTLAESVTDLLRAKRQLLVLDNCEHLLDSAARFVEAVLRDAAHVSVLATSREGLGIGGERMIGVPSLELPDSDLAADAEAVRLFVSRASEASATFRLTDENVAAVSRLVRRLDGIPLAIELAAARVRALTPAELAERVDERFQLLAGGRRTAVERHQTLRRAIDWSYDLLSEPEQRALNRAAVFAGDFSFSAAEAVLAGDGIEPIDVVDLLSRLVDKSLVLAEDHGGTTRYRLLETIRSYAHEHLEATGEAEGRRRRHAEHYAEFAAEAGQGLRGPDEAAWSIHIDDELDNLRGAMTWAIATGDADLALRIVAPLAVHGTSVGYSSSAWAEAVLTVNGAREHQLYPEVMAWAGWAAVLAGELERGIGLANDAVNLATAADVPADAMCRVLFPAGGVAMYAGDAAETRARGDRMLSLADLIDDDYHRVMALNFKGFPFMIAGDREQATHSMEEALRIARRLGNPTALAYSAISAGGNAIDVDPDRARALFDEALDAAVSVRNHMAMGLSVANSALLHIGAGNRHEASARIIRAVEYAHRVGDTGNLKSACVAVAIILLATAGADDVAAVLSGVTPPEVAGAGPWAERLSRSIATVRTRLGDDRFTDAAARGSTLDDEELVELVRHELEPFLEGRELG